MKLIESKAEYIPQTDLYKHIEFCGRTAYKSEDKITEDSAKGFVDRMVKSKHGAVLEHGTVYLIAKVDFTNRDIIDLEDRYTKNPYSKVVVTDGVIYITTNYRVIIENNWLNDMQYISKPTEFHEKRYTIKFTTDRGVSHELVRHRKFSFVQESQRYCNYSKDKFGGEITFVKPSWFKEHQILINADVAQSPDINGAVFYERPYKAYWINTDADGVDWYKEDFFIHGCQTSEACYKLMLAEGCTPQEARAILPNAIKTEVIMTSFASDWRFFFDLRYYGETGKPHPDMELLAGKAREEFIKAGIWEDIISKPSKFDK